MLKSLFNKFSNSRIPLAAKELKWELERTDSFGRAMIHYSATTFRLLNLEPEVNRIVMRPVDFPPDLCKRAYYSLEGAYLKFKRAKYMPGMKEYIGPEATDPNLIFKSSENGMKLLMVTVGTRVNPACYEDVTEIWNMIRKGTEEKVNEILEVHFGSGSAAEIEEQAARMDDENLEFANAMDATPVF